MVVTNGVLLDRMPEAFFNVIDRLEVSQYAGTSTTDAIVDAARRKCVERNKEFVLTDRADFRLMHLDVPNRDDGLLQGIYDSCQIAHVWNWAE